MADAKIDMALDDIIKSNRGGRGNRRGGRGGGLQRQQRGGNNQRGNSRGRINKSNNNRGRGRGGGGGDRNSFNQRNLNRSNNYRPQRGGNRKSFPGFSRRNNNAGDKPTSTYNPLSRESEASTSKQQQQTPKNVTTPRQQQQQGSVFNKIRRTPNAANGNVTALRRRMVAAQRALNRATKTLAAMPRLRQQRQRILQQPQKLRNIISQNRVAGGSIRKRLGTGPRNAGGRGGARGRGRGRRMFV